MIKFGVVFTEIVDEFYITDEKLPKDFKLVIEMDGGTTIVVPKAEDINFWLYKTLERFYVEESNVDYDNEVISIKLR